MFKVPKKTSVWKTEPIPDKYSILFAPELIKFIKDHKKIQTYRFGNKYDYLKPGDIVTLTENNNPKTKIKAKISQKMSTTFINLPLNSPGHESPRDKEHQREIMTGYYAYLGRKIKDDDPFLIFDFELVD